MGETLLTRRGRMTVLFQDPANGRLLLRCPVLKRESPSLLLPSREGTHFALSRDCRLYVFEWSWVPFFSSRSPAPHTGECSELVNVTLAQIGERLEQWASRLDVLFGAGAGNAANVLMKDQRLGLRELRAAMDGMTEVAKRNRAQAIVELPLLYGEIALRDQEHCARGMEYTRLIEDGEPLLRQVPKLFECKPWIIRHLRGVASDDIAPFKREELDALIEGMAWLTPERAPRCPKEYGLLASLCTFRDVEPYYWIVPAIRRSILEGGWGQLETRLPDLHNILDYGRFIERLAVGLTDFEDGLPAAIDSALGHPQFAQIAALSEHWHNIEEGIRSDPAISRKVQVTGSWMPLFDEDLEVDGYDLRCLRTRQELMDEGRTLHHCVASYASRCEIGKSHIVRISRDGRPIATAELQVNGGRGRYRRLAVPQLRGQRNSPPGPGPVNAVAWLVNKLEASDLSAFPDSSEVRVCEDRGVTWLFERMLSMHGVAALDDYRPCLRPNSRQTRFWEHVVARCRSGKLARAEQMSQPDAAADLPVR